MKQNLLIDFRIEFNKKYNTPEKVAVYNKRLTAFREECRQELLLELAEDIKLTRKKSGLSQEELARRLNTQKTNISRIENGKQNLTVEYIVGLATVLGKKVKIRIY